MYSIGIRKTITPLHTYIRGSTIFTEWSQGIFWFETLSLPGFPRENVIPQSQWPSGIGWIKRGTYTAAASGCNDIWTAEWGTARWLDAEVAGRGLSDVNCGKSNNRTHGGNQIPGTVECKAEFHYPLICGWVFLEYRWGVLGWGSRCSSLWTNLLLVRPFLWGVS